MGRILKAHNPDAARQDLMDEIGAGPSEIIVRNSVADDLQRCFAETHGGQTRDWEYGGCEEFLNFSAAETVTMADAMQTTNTLLAQVLHGSGGVTVCN
ncbi:hypothetical protein [Ruegeria sp. HKCCA5491]|uniref:hypothetical protein n=1 Tax=Ruegeria sp. HKCCA5491 TaxID=2682986 RepID=UPI001489997D|nr:hypothetical protein [Ruegeria sp. HKCCA5491]